MSKIIVLMGAPGAGKGTQARLLQERLGLPQISTGDILRALAEQETPLAHEVREIQQSGRLIPDDVVIRVVEERTARDDCRGGYILDGFPGPTVHAERVERPAARAGDQIEGILVDVPSDPLGKRVTGPRRFSVCRDGYNRYFK